LLDGLPPERLERFGLGALPPATGTAEWGGRPCDLLVQDGSAYLAELARTLSSLLSRPGREVTMRAVSGGELASRRKSGAYSLLLGLVRPFGALGVATLVALAAAGDPMAARDIVRRPPRLTSFAPRMLTRTLKIGVLGELRVAGAHAPDVHLAKNAAGEGWDLGSSYRSAT
jgi:peptide/nickel transport system substrate-binding protein